MLVHIGEGRTPNLFAYIIININSCYLSAMCNEKTHINKGQLGWGPSPPIIIEGLEEKIVTHKLENY